MKDDRGVMMLMTAVILIIGFLALSGMTARTSQIPQEIDAARGQEFVQEVESVARYLHALTQGGLTTACDATELAELNKTLNGLRLQLHSRGHAFVWSSSCEMSDYRVAFCLSDGLADVRSVVGAESLSAQGPFNCSPLGNVRWTILA